MSETTTSPAREVIARQWLFVVIPAVIGLAVALVMTGGAPPASWVATQRLAVYPVPNGAAKDLKPAAVIAAASTPGVRRAVETTLGLQAGDVEGSLSARSDNTDPSVVVFSAKAPSKDEASALLEAGIEATKKRVLSAYAFVVATGLEEAKTYDGYVADLKQRVSDVDRQAASAGPAERASLEQARALYIQQMLDFEARALVTRNSMAYVDATIVAVSDPAVTRSSNTRARLGLVLQGLIAGLSIGLIIAAGREWTRSRRRAA